MTCAECLRRITPADNAAPAGYHEPVCGDCIAPGEAHDADLEQLRVALGVAL